MRHNRNIKNSAKQTDTVKHNNLAKAIFEDK